MARSFGWSIRGCTTRDGERNRREDIFLDDDDRGFFLKAVSEACAQTGWLAHAWVLMSNHYHLCIETPEANLGTG